MEERKNEEIILLQVCIDSQGSNLLVLGGQSDRSYSVSTDGVYSQPKIRVVCVLE